MNTNTTHGITKPRVLLVDDNEGLLFFLSEDLKSLYDVSTSFNGHEALKIIDETPIDLIISDVMMPEMDGFELCHIIKTNVEYSHIPVILLTAKSSLQSKIDGLNIGADSYVEKPFSPEFLRAQIASLLKNRNNIKEFFLHTPLIKIASIAHTKTDEIFLEKLNNLILENIEDNELDVNKLAILMHMSRPTLYRKIKSITNLTPNEIINVTRLKHASQLLHNTDAKINEVASSVGYSCSDIFTKNFKKQFNMTPSEYMSSLKKRV